MMPKMLHLYWGKNKPLSFLRSLTVETFNRLNPDWRIIVWTPSEPSHITPWATGEQTSQYNGEDHLSRLADFAELKSFTFDTIGVPPDLPEVHKADLIRWYLLGQYGGVWSDFDIIYTDPIKERMMAEWKGAGLCRYRALRERSHRFLAIGFLTAEGQWGGSVFYKNLFRVAMGLERQTEYQAYGAKLLERFIANYEFENDFFYLDPDLVYHYRMNKDMALYFSKDHIESNDERIGLHWYGGNPMCGKFESDITPDNFEHAARRFAICKEAMRVCQLSTVS